MSKDIVKLINSMIVEYSNMEYDNNRRYPLDEEVELTRKGRYGQLALEDLLNRIENNE